MLDTLKRLAKHSFIYGVGNLAVLLPGFILVPIYTKRLTTGEYGILSIMTVFTGMLALIYELGMISALTRQYYEYDDLKARYKAISTAFTFLLVWAAVITLCLIYFASPLSQIFFQTSQFHDIIIISLLSIFCSALIFVPQTTLRVEEKSGLFVILSIVRVVLTVLFTIVYLSFTQKSLLGVFKAMLWATAASAAIFLIFTYRRIKLFEFSFVDLRQMLKFGIAFFPAAFFTWIIDYSNRYILSLYVDMGQVGIYSLGQKISQVVVILIKAFHLAYVPIIFSLVMRSEAKRIFSSIFTYFIFLLSTLVLGLCLYSKEIVTILSSPSYIEAHKVIPIIAISGIGYGAYLYFVTALSISKKVMSQPFILAFVAIINVPLNIIFIKKIGMMGAAFATLLTYVIITLLTYFFAQRHYKIAYEYLRLAKILFSFTVVYCMSLFLRIGFPANNAWMSNPILLAFFFVFLYATGFFKKSEIAFLLKTISTIRGKI